MNLIKIWLKEFYNLEGELSPLDGYANENYCLISRTGEKYIVKLNSDISELGLIEAQNNLLSYLSEKSSQANFPKPLFSQKGKSVEIIQNNGNSKILRVLTWLEGNLIKDAPHSEDLFEELGLTLGSLDKTLVGFKDPRISERYSDWDLQHALVTARDSGMIENKENRRLAEYYFLQYETLVSSQLTSLRKGIIHADANDFNILVDNNKVTGIIDFGDCVYSPIINELAIALAYVLMEKDDPVEWALYVTRGYHASFPLEPVELELLYYLIAGRLAMSVTKSSVSRKRNPDNEYLLVSEKTAWKLLWKWIEINPESFIDRIKQACDIPSNRVYSEDELLKMRNMHISGSLSISYKQPIAMQKAALQYMYSQDGQTYLDCVNNICHVGHAHPRVVKAGQKQMALMNTNTRYLYKNLLEYSSRLAAKFPDPLDTIFFVNSGSEAGDLAQRIARTITGQRNTIVVDHAYHGNTIAGIEVSPYKYEGKGGFGKAEHISKLQIPDGFRGQYKYDDPEAGKKYASEIDNVIELLSSKDKGIAAFYCESIIGCGGQVVLPEGYLNYIYQRVREKGGLCIADEVQVGFGRVGEQFWGFELQQVVPDIVVLGKPMGNGHPMAAVITTKAIADQFNNGMEFFSSFGGNPVSCAIGLEVLNVIEEEGLQQHAFETGEYFKESLLTLMSKHELVGDVRGYGLFLGIEFVADRSSQSPATLQTKAIVEEMKNRGILLSTDGPYNNVIKIKPPLVFDRRNVDRVVGTLDEVLNRIE